MEQQAVKLFDWVDFMRNGYSSKLTDDSARPQVYALCANNYPFALSGRTDFKEAFDFNGRVRKISGNRRAEFGLPAGEGVSLVEMSDDCFAIPHLRAAKEHISQGRILEELNYSARENGVRICAVGTGAELSYAHVKEEGQAVFDRPPKARKYWLDKIFDAWGEWALALGVQVYTGKRPAVFANEKVFTDQVKLKNLSNYIKEVGGIDVSVPSFHPQEDLTNPDLEINGAEALNLGLSLYLNQDRKSVV